MDELKHYGVKGMKWGIRRNRKTSGSKNKRKRSISDIERKIKNGAEASKNFLRKNGKVLATSSAILGLSLVGIPYAPLAISTLSKLDLSNAVTSHSTRETLYKSRTIRGSDGEILDKQESGDSSWLERERIR